MFMGNMNETLIYYLHYGDNIPFYIGKTVNERRRRHEHFFQDKKIKLEIIDKIPSSEWIFWERWYISLFKSWGFYLKNKNKGGNGCSHQNDLSKKQISKNMKGKNNWSVGGYNKNSVLQYNLEGEFIKKYESTEEVKKTLNLRVGPCCRNQTKTCGGFIWVYEKNFKNTNLSNKIHNVKVHGNLNKKKSKEHATKLTKRLLSYISDPIFYKKKRKIILQYDINGNLIQEWESIKKASLELNICSSSINNNLKKRYKHAGNYIWEYKK
jgi:hypothetical protein